ncbi:MAG: glycoside hydrolase family 88 protein [Bacteroidales bacterium]
MKRIVILIIILSALCTKSEAKWSKPPQWVKNAISRSEVQLLTAAETFQNSKKCPRSFENGSVTLACTTDWTCGFFPGSLWYMYELTKNEQFKTEAIRYTEFLNAVQFRTDTHDLGFMLNCSYGNGFRILGNDSYKNVMITGAKSLMTRFHPEIGLIKSWDNRRNWQFPVIIDNMMNLEFLFDIGKMIGDSNMVKAAISHANRTLENHFRPDNSCFHVVNYDSISGKVISKETHQGFNDSSSWARGQAWALYGYTMMYRETKDSKYLDQAQKVAQFILNNPNLPKDKIPYWDFNAPRIPDEPRDASAAALYASALIELSGFVKNDKNYLKTAETILKNLSSDNYLAKKGENGLFILKHSTGNWPKKSEVDAPLNYADYYYLEALGRYMRAKNIKL